MTGHRADVATWAKGAGWRRLALALTLALTMACVPIYRNHGFIPFEEDLAALQVGVDTRETVTAKVGSPTSTGITTPTGFYYVASRFRHYGPLEPQEIDREVLAITFTEGGTLRNIERFGLEDGQVVVLSRRVTDDNIPDTTFLGQLLGNIGNFDPAVLLPQGI